jgi:C4-dicarboxylate-specific signal transduction histidine kinase
MQTQLLNVSRLATIGEMTSGIAHEVNQPLCAVANYAQACARLLALPNPDITSIREALDNITSQALRAAEVIRRLRSLAQSGDPRQQITDINALLVQLGELLQSEAKYHKVQYVLEPGPQLPPVCVDQAQIQQLVLNLVHNALEALAEVPPESRKIAVRTSGNDRGEVEIAVSDNGPGISAAMLPHLFTPFYTSKRAGTGLGLAMSRTLAQANSGTLHYHPASPTGSCFVVTLPAKSMPIHSSECRRAVLTENT